MKENKKMDRKILFRGKSTEQKKWLYGDILHEIHEGGPIATPSIHYEKNGLPWFENVEIGTIGQYIGLEDRKGTKIFEGDVLKCTQKESLEYNDDGISDRYVVKFDFGWIGCCGFTAFPVSSLDDESFEMAVQQLGGDITWPNNNVLLNHQHYDIIGNIHDQPELGKNGLIEYHP